MLQNEIVIKKDTSYITVTIPSYKEPNLMIIIDSLMNCDRKGIILSVHILLNCSIEASGEVKKSHLITMNEVKLYIAKNGFEDILDITSVEFEPKHAGVGLARKTLMDNASNEFREHEINGIVTALDADCIVESNYLQSINSFFKDSKYEAASIFFEHPIDATSSSLPIIEYEYHLRYFISMQRFIDFPFAIHTVGSSMACLSESYLKKGGMNKRKAGEDFYFLHKFIKDGVCGLLGETTVFPDGRISDRVPFGTGRAIGKYEEIDYTATTYNPKSFQELSKISMALDSWYTGEVKVDKFEKITQDFFTTIKFIEKVEDIKKHVANLASFKKRFYQFFDAFQLMKALHFIRDEYSDINIEDAARYFQKEIIDKPFTSMQDALKSIREYERAIYLN